MGVKCREWVLDDGSTWTTKAVSDLINCSSSNAYSRLMGSKDPSIVLRPMGMAKKIDGKRSLSNRMYFDPLGHWKLLNKYV